MSPAIRVICHVGIEYTDFNYFGVIYIYEFLGALYLVDMQFVDPEWSFGVIFINLFKELCVCCISADTKHCVSLTFKCLHE